MNVAGVAEGHDVRGIERGQRDPRGAIAAEPITELSAQPDREDVLILDRHQRAVCPRPDLERPVGTASLLADLDQHVRDADQIPILVDEYADARVVAPELADVEA